LLIASRLNSAQPALGPRLRARRDRRGGHRWHLAQPVGTGSVVGTIIGAFIMSVLTNGLRILNVSHRSGRP
jgi:ribose transport system permease protein